MRSEAESGGQRTAASGPGSGAVRWRWLRRFTAGLLLVGTLPVSAQESGRVWTLSSMQYDTQAAAEAALWANYSAYRYIKDVEVRDAQTYYHYWRGAAVPSESVWEYANQGSGTPYLTEQEAHDALKVFYQTLSDQRGCSHVSVVADGEWTRTGGYTNGPSSNEKRTYTATYTGCSYSPSNTAMFRERTVACPANLSWNSAEGVCGGGATQVIASKPVACTAGCTRVDNPVDVANGEKYQPEPPDFDLGWVSFARTYHSGTASGRSALGRGWTHNHAMRLTLNGGAAVGLIREDGSEIPLKAFAGYREAVDGSGDRVTGSGPWTLHTASRVVSFDARGRMTEQRFDDGSALTYQHDAIDRIVSIVHSTGRSLSFEYVDADVSLEPRIAAIRADGLLLASYVHPPAGTLTSVVFADGSGRAYHYEDSRFPWHLTGVSIAGARYSTYQYDAKGRMTASSYAGGVPGSSFVYPASGGAIVTDADGLQTTYGITADGADVPYRQLSGATHSGGSESRTYFPIATDFRRRLSESVDRNNVVTKHEYVEATDAVSGEQVLIHTVREAYGTTLERSSEIRRSLASNRVLMTRAGNRETRVVRNARLQPMAISIKDTATNTTRTSTLTYCEQADVDAGSCPRVGLLVAADGPRTDAADIVSYQYRMADHPDCAAVPATCAWRKGDPWKTTNALGQIIEILAHDGAGRVRSIRDANGVITDIEYDPRGRPTATKIRGVDAGSESDDRIARIEYWPDGAVKKTIQPDGAFLLFDYDDARRLTTIVDNDGNAIVYTLNASGERTKEEVLDATGTLRRTLARSYNALGQLIAIRDARAQTPNGSGGYLYPATMSYTYDPEGRLDLATDALGRQTDHDYDALGRLTRSLQNATAATTAPDRAEIISEYDALDRTTRIIDPNGLHTTYGYNVFGDLLQQTSPDTGLTTSSHDSGGNPTQTTDADGRQRTRAYDALGRVTAVSYPQDTTLNETYVYDTAQSDCTADESFLVGRLSRMTDGSGNTTYCYNRFGDLTRKVQRTQGKTFVLQWQYAVNGRLLGMTLPSGALLDYSHDAQGRVAEIGATTEGQRTPVVSNTSYHPFAGPARWQSANGRAVVRTQNQNGQPGILQAQDQAGAAIDGISLGYEFDAVGNLKRLRNGHQAEPPTRIYDHDALNRLIEARDAANEVWQSYSYDKTGNRQTAGWRTVQMNQDCSASGDNCTPLPPTTQWQSESYTRYTASHRLFTKGQRLRSYDNAGNLTLDAPNEAIPIDPPPGGETESAAYEGTLQSVASDGGESSPANGELTRSFSYNAANRMSGTSLAGELRMSYRYNGAGERVYRQGGGKTVHTVFDPSGRWLGDYDANGLLIQEAIWLGDLPVGLLARVAGDVRLFHIEPDALGTPRVVVDPTRGATGTVVWRWELAGEAFGNDKPNEDPDNDGTAFVLDMRYPGQQYDSATGFNYNYFRDYDASTGRYVESDPIGLAGGISTYGYAGGNSLNQADPLGLEVIGIHTNTTSSGPKTEHSWIGIYDDSGNLRMTIGAWKKTHRAVVGVPAACQCEDGVYWNMEKNLGYVGVSNFYFYASKDQVRKIMDFSMQEWSWRLYSNNCATWVEEAMQKAYPGLDLLTASFSTGFADSPHVLSLNIEYFRQQYPQNSATSPYVLGSKP